MDDLFRSTEKDLDQIGKISEGGHPGFPKFVVWGVSVFCFFVLIAIFARFQSNLTIEYPQIAGTDINKLDLSPTKSLAELEDEQLRTQDSDQDGLTDYEELRVYGTSAYIADSDSDGLSDKQEIDAGEDPNCPRGETCFGSNVEELVDAPSPFETEEVRSVVSDPASIRQLLIDGGVNPIVVNQIDDQTLQVLASQAFQALSNPTEEKIALLESLTPAEIRSVLKFAGADEQVLEELSDEELQELYDQSLEIELSNQ